MSRIVLGDLVQLQRGTTYKSNLLGQPGPVLLGLASIQRNGGFRDDNLKTYGGASPEKLLLRPGDIFVSLKDVTQAGDLLGAVARVPHHVPLGRVTQDTVKLGFLEPEKWSGYVYWLLRTPMYRQYCRSHATGTTNLGLPRSDFLAFEIPDRSAVRETLVALLQALDDKIELNRRMNETLEAMARALFKSWFIDFDPVRAKMAGRAPAGMDPATAALFPDAMSYDTPKGWAVRALKDLACINEWTLGASDDLAELEYVEISDVVRGKVLGTTRYPRGSEPSRARRRLRHGDTVISTVRPERASYFLCLRPSPSLVGSTGFAVLTPLDTPWSFLHCGATQPSNFEELGRLADGGAYPAVRPDAVAGLKFAVPDNMGISVAFHERAAPLFELCYSNDVQSKTLAALRDLLLPKLLSGELRVRDAERAVEKAL